LDPQSAQFEDMRLLDKAERRKVDVTIDYCGFQIPDILWWATAGCG
jgi:hypoxanthine-guanine phosphoribosyltransferase